MKSTVKLHSQIIGSGSHREILILHGLFGNSSNWKSIATKLSQLSQSRCHLLDLRNHGVSPHSDQMSYQAMIEDVLQYLHDHNLLSKKITIVGHSMGGKVAMKFNLEHPTIPSELVVVDIAPVAYPKREMNVFQKYAHAMSLVDLSTIKSRSEVDEQLKSEIHEKAVRQFLLANLVSNNDHYSWRFNLPAISRSINSLGDFPLSSHSLSYSGPTLSIYGGKSKYVLPEYFPIFGKLFPSAKFQKIDDAGHWVHSEKPQEVIEAIQKLISK